MNDSRKNWRRWARISSACIDLRPLWAGLLALSVAACSQPYAWDGSLEHLLESQPERFGAVLEDPARYRVQILYTQIDRDADNRPTFRSYAYRLDPDEYFYPASTVKLFAAVAGHRHRFTGSSTNLPHPLRNRPRSARPVCPLRVTMRLFRTL